MKKKLTALLLALVLCCSISVPALAATEIGETSPGYTVGKGVSYKYWASFYEDRGRYKAAAWIQTTDSSPIAVGAVTARAIVEDSTNRIIKSSIAEVTTPYYFIVAESPYTFFAGTNITAYGLFQVVGVEEPIMTAKLTTSQAAALADEESGVLSVNSRGETYCSYSPATAKMHPDLVAAVGTEGQSGYVRYDELFTVDRDVFANGCCGKNITLYDLDGNDIGLFFVEYTQPDLVGKDIETVKAEIAASTAQSPELWDLAQEVLVDGKYPVNAKGQTYGPDILREMVGYSPDLTPAVNQDGLAGYIRTVKELPMSEEESAAYRAATSEPLYDVDGNVIGTLEWCPEPNPVQVIGKTVPEVRTELAGQTLVE